MTDEADDLCPRPEFPPAPENDPLAPPLYPSVVYRCQTPDEAEQLLAGTLPGSDIDSATLTYAITQNPTKGTISNFNAATGAYTYTPNANTSGVDTIGYTVSDGTTTTAPATITFTVSAVNDAPVAGGDRLDARHVAA